MEDPKITRYASESYVRSYVDAKITNSLEDNNKYILISNDDPLTIKVSDITELTDATITIDNLTGEFGTLVANENGDYTYTLNTIMTDVETFVFKVNGDEQNVVIVPYREMVYDDSNGAITYTGTTWTIDEDNNHYNGAALKGTSGAIATFKFTGTGVDIYSRIDLTTGKVFAALTNDGEVEASKFMIVDTKSASGTYYQIPTLFFEGLDYGTYEVKIQVLNPVQDGEISRGTYYLDGIRVYNTLGNNLNESINNLYQIKDTNPSVLYTDRGNRKYIPTREYDPATKIYVDDLIKNNLLTDEELINALSESDYLIPINVEISGSNNSLEKIEIFDKNNKTIYSEVTETSIHSQPFCVDIYLTQEIMNNVAFHIVYTNNVCSLGSIEMNDKLLNVNTDYEVEEGNKVVNITLKQITGDIIIDIPGPPPS